LHGRLQNPRQENARSWVLRTPQEEGRRPKPSVGGERLGKVEARSRGRLLKIKHGFFAEIDKRLARLAVIERHYLHRPCPITWAWGVVVDEKLKGVLTVGRPCSENGLRGRVRQREVGRRVRIESAVAGRRSPVQLRKPIYRMVFARIAEDESERDSSLLR